MEAIQWLYFSYILNAIEKNANAKMTKKISNKFMYN